MRIVGSILILSGAFWGWWVQRREERVRRRVRLEILSALERMAEEIRLARTPMPRLLETVASDCSEGGRSFFSAVSSAIARGERPEGAWRSFAERLPLEEGERRALQEVGQAFGGDEERLCRGLNLAAAALRRQAEAAEKCRMDEEKRRAALWGCAGAMTVILLI
ncbi:MAG: hypothetical protein IJF36_02225 [Oscillibacter sp.]|nr:hypothetical protein [Oscillibacter sp.]